MAQTASLMEKVEALEYQRNPQIAALFNVRGYSLNPNPRYVIARGEDIGDIRKKMEGIENASRVDLIATRELDSPGHLESLAAEYKEFLQERGEDTVTLSNKARIKPLIDRHNYELTPSKI